mgnify:CR=1 FL=1
MNLGTFEDPVYPDVEKMLAERRELFRLAGCNALARSRNGRDLDPEARAWAHRMAAVVPLGRPLSEGVS